MSVYCWDMLIWDMTSQSNAYRPRQNAMTHYSVRILHGDRSQIESPWGVLSGRPPIAILSRLWSHQVIAPSAWVATRITYQCAFEWPKFFWRSHVQSETCNWIAPGGKACQGKRISSRKWRGSPDGSGWKHKEGKRSSNFWKWSFALRTSRVPLSIKKMILIPILFSHWSTTWTSWYQGQLDHCSEESGSVLAQHLGMAYLEILSSSEANQQQDRSSDTWTTSIAGTVVVCPRVLPEVRRRYWPGFSVRVCPCSIRYVNHISSEVRHLKEQSREGTAG